MAGRVLNVDGLARHEDYCGPEPIAVGIEIAENGAIDARIIGDAVASGRYGVGVLKRLWRITARWGAPR